MRYKEFNSNKVLDTCIHLFWNTSFWGCAVKEIVAATNVNRFSLYEEFDNKEGILTASIDLYKERHIPEKLALLNAKGDLIEILKSFYMSFMTDKESHPSGCYIIRISTELADSNTDVKNKLDVYLIEIENAFKLLLQKYPECKDSINYLSKHLTGLFCSLTTFCVIHSYEERASLVNSGLSMLLKNNAIYATHS